MKIILKRLSLVNFKGIRSLDIDFGDVTNISGRNRLGKTTIKDAFLWLFFGKDSSDRKDFSIKTLDEHNQPYHKLDHEVTAHLDIEGQPLVIRRSLKENWVTKRGEKNQVFSGHTTSFYWDEVPLKESEFQAKIAGILPENIFKLITSPEYFNCSLKWQERRNILLEIAGDISNDDVIQAMGAKNGALTSLINAFNAKKSPEEFKRELANKKKKIKDELQLIPSRIDEANRSLPDEVDYEEINSLIDNANGALESIEKKLMDQTAAMQEKQDAINEKIKRLGDLKNERLEVEFQIRSKVMDAARSRKDAILDLERDIKAMNSEVSRLRDDHKRNSDLKVKLEKERDELRARYEKIDQEQLGFNDAEFSCPTCKREYETSGIEEKKEEMKRNFNADKSKRLADIQLRGKRVALEIEGFATTLGNISAAGTEKANELEKLTGRLEQLKIEDERLSSDEMGQIQKEIENSTEITAIFNATKDLEEEITAAKSHLSSGNDNNELLEKKQQLQVALDNYKKQLATKDQRERIQSRIEELSKQEQEMSNQLADLEGQEYTLEQFMKTKMDELDRRINGRFRTLRFKLFDTQINGGEVECCETLVNGVPYSDVNTAGRINAGLEIINVLSDHYQVSAPVFVDNAESINTLVPLNGQLIRLVVSLDDKLRIETEEHQPAMAEA